MAASSSISALNERLRHVATKGNIEEMEQLIRLGATFDTDRYGRTALHYAAQSGQVKAIRLCVARGCDQDVEDSYGRTALHVAVVSDGHVDAVRALLEEGCDVDRQDEKGNTALHEAAWYGFSQSVDTIIKMGKANVHASNKTGQKPVHLACQNGRNQSTRLLLKAGTHPNVKNNSGETPLHIACLFGHITCARILLSAGCDANAKKQDGNTALHVAASLGKLKITRLLIESQCQVELRNKNNQTALELARQNDHADAVLLLLGAHKLRKGKRSFFSLKKKKGGDPADDLGDTSHHHHRHGDHSPHKHDDKHGRGHRDEKGCDDDVDGDHGGARVRGRRELGGLERHSSGSSKGKSKKKRNQVSDQHLFVKEELRKKVRSEKKLQAEIQRGREMGNPTGAGHPLVRTQLFKDKTGKILEVPMPVHCNCSSYIKKLENQVEASKERLLHEMDMSKARFEGRMNNMEKRMAHQAQCLDQLCKERIAAERADCIHRIDQRAMEERERLAKDQERRADALRRELRQWFESRIQPLHEQLSRTCLDDACIEAPQAARRGRPRAGRYRLQGHDMAFGRVRSKSESNLSDCDFMEEEEDEEDSEEEDESDEEEDEIDHGGHFSMEETQTSSQLPSEQSPHRYKNGGSRSEESEYAKTGAIPKKGRSCSFRQAVSDEDRQSGGSNSSRGTPLSMVAGTYRPPLVASHERSPPVDPHHSLPPDFVLPSQETDDTDSSETDTDTDTETASQMSLETVSARAKSIGGSTHVSSSTRDSGHHTMKGSSVSSGRRSSAPMSGDQIAYQALTVNARPPPPLQAAVTNSRPLFSAQPPPSQLRVHSNFSPAFSPPVSPSSTASQPLSTSTLTSSEGQRMVTPINEHPTSENPSPTDSAKTPSSTSSSGVSSGEASSFPNSSPIKYNVVSPQSGQSYQRIYNPRAPAAHQSDLVKDVATRNWAPPRRDEPPAYSSRTNGALRGGPPPHWNSGNQVRNFNNGNNNGSYVPNNPTMDHPGNGHPYRQPNPNRPPSRTFAMIGRPIGTQNRPDATNNPAGTHYENGAGGSAVPPRSAASRLGVTPSLSAVRYSSSQAPPNGMSHPPQQTLPTTHMPSRSGGNVANTYASSDSRTLPPGSRTGAVQPPSFTAANSSRPNGVDVRNGSSSSGTFMRDVEHYNRSAPPQQKLKYTKELFL
ncbi:uncharacterized protein [Diadema setosum]|uniref:uncharacterized protein n=1 Tax=Diadema setosum TaxID=31175 RepID=UPI003B3A2761